MTVDEILDQARLLSPSERSELAKLLIDLLGTAEAVPQSKTGAEIVQMLLAMEPIAFADPDIDDPVEWVAAQRQKDADRLKPYWDGDA